MKSPKEILRDLIAKEEQRLVSIEMSALWATKRLAAKEEREELDTAAAWLNTLPEEVPSAAPGLH